VELLCRNIFKGLGKSRNQYIIIKDFGTVPGLPMRISGTTGTSTSRLYILLVRVSTAAAAMITATVTEAREVVIATAITAVMKVL